MTIKIDKTKLLNKLKNNAFGNPNPSIKNSYNDLTINGNTFKHVPMIFDDESQEFILEPETIKHLDKY